MTSRTRQNSFTSPPWSRAIGARASTNAVGTIAHWLCLATFLFGVSACVEETSASHSAPAVSQLETTSPEDDAEQRAIESMEGADRFFHECSTQILGPQQSPVPRPPMRVIASTPSATFEVTPAPMDLESSPEGHDDAVGPSHAVHQGYGPAIITYEHFRARQRVYRSTTTTATTDYEFATFRVDSHIDVDFLFQHRADHKQGRPEFTAKFLRVEAAGGDHLSIAHGVMPASGEVWECGSQTGRLRCARSTAPSDWFTPPDWLAVAPSQGLASTSSLVGDRAVIATEGVAYATALSPEHPASAALHIFPRLGDFVLQPGNYLAVLSGHVPEITRHGSALWEARGVAAGRHRVDTIDHGHALAVMWTAQGASNAVDGTRVERALTRAVCAVTERVVDYAPHNLVLAAP